jgi:hypothetical protein
MVSIHIRLTNRTAYTQTQEEVIYKDEHINTDTNLKLTGCVMNRVCASRIHLIVMSKMNKKSKQNGEYSYYNETYTSVSRRRRTLTKMSI